MGVIKYLSRGTSHAQPYAFLQMPGLPSDQNRKAQQQKIQDRQIVRRRTALAKWLHISNNPGSNVGSNVLPDDCDHSVFFDSHFVHALYMPTNE